MKTFCPLLTAQGWGVIRRFYHPKPSKIRQNSLSHSSTHRTPAQIAFAGLTSELVSEQRRVLVLSALNRGKRREEEKKSERKKAWGETQERMAAERTTDAERESAQCPSPVCELKSLQDFSAARRPLPP